MEDINVIVCDDSALMRNLISKIVNSTQGMNVVGTAMNGKFLLQKIPLLKPDLILLDIEMPEMTGIEFLKERRARGIDVPVVVLSSIAEKGAPVTIQCLELGASDFITKPNGSTSINIATVSDLIIEKAASYGRRYAFRKGKEVPPLDFYLKQIKQKEAEQDAKNKGLTEKVKNLENSLKNVSTLSPTLFQTKPKEPEVIEPLRQPGKIDVVAIGISTGGPNALREVFSKLHPKFPKPILVVQHMPAGFTKEFAASLNRICPISVKEAEDGDLIHPGQIYIAPGDYHIVVEKSTLCHVIRLSQAEQRNGHRPSADVLFESVAKEYTNHALGVIMTGMGRDGAAQLAEMRRQGAWTLGQDEKSSIVYGMPKVGWEKGAVQRQVALEDMADAINKTVMENC